MTYDTIYLLKL